MSRSRPVPPDSLEMLLDTMCNTFGGIILIALLVALLSRDSRVTETNGTTPVAGAEDLADRLQQAERDLAQAQDRERQLRRDSEDPGKSARLALLQERDQARREVEALTDALRNQASTSSETPDQVIARLEAMAAENLQAERRLTEERNRGASLAGRIDALKRGVQSLSNRLAQVEARQSRRRRLPREHASTREAFPLIARYGRVHPVYQFRDGQASRNTGTLRWTEESPETYRVEAIQGLGMVPATNSPAWSALLREVPRTQFYLVFHVYPDSFESYLEAKDLAVERGFECGWIPILETNLLRVGAGAARPPVQ